MGKGTSLSRCFKAPILFFLCSQSSLEFCFSLGVDCPLVFLLWLAWETLCRLCDLLNYVPSTRVVLVSFLLLVFPLPDIPIHASSIPILSFLLQTSTSSGLKSFWVSVQWTFTALHGVNVSFGIRKAAQLMLGALCPFTSLQVTL